MANYMKCVAGVGNVEMSDEDHAARVAEEEAFEVRKPAKAWDRLRIERNRLLAETDYLALKDITLSNSMKVYRKALRDLPESYSNSSITGPITWPTKP